jgi:Ribbon-helix-helix protein, copG family
MVRTQVYFSEEQHRALRRAAKREGVSMTALLRRMVERELLGRTTKPDYSKDAIMAIVGLGRSGRSDISENHDEALAEAFRDETLR